MAEVDPFWYVVLWFEVVISSECIFKWFPFTVITQSVDSMSLSCLGSSLKNHMKLLNVLRLFGAEPYESECSDSVSLSSFRVHFHFLYLSIRSIKYEFFFAFLINGYLSNSLAVGLCKITTANTLNRPLFTETQTLHFPGLYSSTPPQTPWTVCCNCRSVEAGYFLVSETAPSSDAVLSSEALLWPIQLRLFLKTIYQPSNRKPTVLSLRVPSKTEFLKKCN